MKRILMAAIAGSMLAGVAHADEKYNPDCHLEAIDPSINSVIDQIKSSPALGHAGGHYAKALKDLEAVKKQLHEGCVVWNKGQKK